MSKNTAQSRITALGIWLSSIKKYGNAKIWRSDKVASAKPKKKHHEKTY